jgi:hypothetical protein
MSKSVLKKEFKEKDVQRLRNLVQGKHGERSTQGIGYTKTQEFHNEGDIWEEDGRQWTIKNGIKQNITKLDKAKESIHMPLFCPSCSNLMKKQADKRFYLQFKRCLDCQIDFEAELKKQGLWEVYDNAFINDNVDNLINEFEIWFEEAINHSNEDFITENGDVEKWVGSAKDKMLESKEETIAFLKKLKK